MTHRSVVSLKVSTIPKYLCSSELYLSFSDEAGDEEICVPCDCVKADLTINTAADVAYLLRTMRFWILAHFDGLVMRHMTTQADFYWSNVAEISAIFHEFESAFPGLYQLVYEVNTSNKEERHRQRCEIAAKYGRVDFLEYFISLNYLVDIPTLMVAATHGHLHCTKHIYNALSANRDTQGLLNVNMREVVRNGHADCLKFLVQRGARVTDNLCVQAIQSHQLSCLTYLLSMTTSRCEVFTISAIECGDICVLECVLQYECVVQNRVWTAAATATNAAPFHRLLESFPSTMYNQELMQYIVARAHAPALHVLLQRGYTFSTTTITHAARQGNLQCLQFLSEHCSFDCWLPSTMAAAAAGGQLDLIHTLHEQGCAWDETAPTVALQAEQKACLTFFLKLRGVPKLPEFTSIAPYHTCELTVLLYRAMDMMRDMMQNMQVIITWSRKKVLMRQLRSV